MKKPELGYLVFEATAACNLRCRYCYNIWHAPGGEQPPPTTYERARRALKRAFKTATIGQVAFTGGEPFLLERLPELVLWVRRQGAGVTVITNGTAAGPAEYQSLLDLGVGLFELPLHSPDPAIHDAMTAVPSSWERSRASIIELVRRQAELVGVIVITRLNAGQVADTLRLFAELGVRRVMLARFNVGGRGIAEREALTPTHAQLRQAFADAAALAADGRVTLSANVCLPVCVIDPRDYPQIPISTCSTASERRPLTLDAAGDVRLCNHSPVKAGNIFAQGWGEILGSAYVKQWGEVIPDYCEDCADWRRCLGGCRAASEQLGGGLGEVDPIVTGR